MTDDLQQARVEAAAKAFLNSEASAKATTPVEVSISAALAAPASAACDCGSTSGIHSPTCEKLAVPASAAPSAHLMLIAAEWEKVCEDAELDTDATAAEVVDALRLQGFQNMGKDVPAPAEPEKAHYHAWSEIPCEPGKCRMEAEPSEDERYNPVYDIITDVLDEYTDMGVRHEVAVEIIDRVRKAGAWPAPAVPTEDANGEWVEKLKLIAHDALVEKFGWVEHRIHHAVVDALVPHISVKGIVEDAELVDELLEEAKLWRDMHLGASVADDLIRRLVERLEEVTRG